MPQPLNYLRETASQTAGPYVHIGLAPRAAGFEMFETELGADIAGAAKGERIVVTGRVIDGVGAPVRDALIEVWQADAQGRYPERGDAFRGWGRVVPDFDSGEWRIETIKPGRVAGRHGQAQAPHLSLWIVARGINIGLSTRLYFADEAEANAADPVLNLVEPAVRRETLVAATDGDGAYRMDIVLQGERETVFLDI